MESRKLFILEMANNHMGDVEHGKVILREMYNVARSFPQFDFAIKFQMRDLDTFIHPHYKDRDDLKYVKRFKETQLSKDSFIELKKFAEWKGFKTICTAFDEKSVDVIEELGFSQIKIASCSVTDWPLLNRIAKTDLPIIASTAGASISEIDQVVQFFLNRNKDLTLLHCVGEYPTKPENFQLNQIKRLKDRYDIKVGLSTHERPSITNSIVAAIGAGAEVFEKHVGVETVKYELNDYSADPWEVHSWLLAAKDAEIACGAAEGKPECTDKELSDLRTFKRGVFAKRDIESGEEITREDVFYAFPCVEGQILANDMSKYTKFFATRQYFKNDAVMLEASLQENTRKKVLMIRDKVKALVALSRVVIPAGAPLEISHHYGLDQFEEIGLCLVTAVNEGYCKKLLISLPNQYHPIQYHKKKKETFVMLWGDATLVIPGKENQKLYPGDVVTIEPGEMHSFYAGEGGCVIEEISTTHYKDDSYYEDEEIQNNKNRKTIVSYW